MNISGNIIKRISKILGEAKNSQVSLEQALKLTGNDKLVPKMVKLALKINKAFPKNKIQYDFDSKAIFLFDKDEKIRRQYVSLYGDNIVGDIFNKEPKKGKDWKALVDKGVIIDYGFGDFILIGFN